MNDAPRDNLIRANFGARAASVQGRTMTGYPIVFDEWTTINSWEGNFRERIAPTALNKTLAERGDQIKVLFNHGMDPQIGDKPLGKPSVMRADQVGMWGEVPLSQTTYNDDLLALMRDGALDGQSFRFSVPEGKDEWVRKEGHLPERTIVELRLYEWGPVTFPAYLATTVGIRSRDAFGVWMGLDDERRNSIAQIMGFDLRTLSNEAAESTSEEEAATEQNDSEPLGAHSGVTIIRRRALAAAQLLRSHTDNGTC